MQPPLSNCSCEQDTVILNWFKQLWHNRHVAGAFYFASMLYLFVGIAIASDIFMNSVESITSQTKKVKQFNQKSKKFEMVSVRVWNQTVANLTLMAFGSSAPEILLATIEIIKNRFKSEKTGPGTIVGASMFNTFVITAFCVTCLPAGQNKRIRNIKVFWISTFFSLAAYVWLYLILSVFTPNQVTIVEALITLLLFPVMVVCGYVAEKNLFFPSNSIYSQIEERRSVQNQSSIEAAETNSEHHHNNNNEANQELTNANTDDDDDDERSFRDKLKEWPTQIKEAFEVIPSEQSTNDTNVWQNYVFHFFSFFWKVAFSLIPPPTIVGGWLTFFSSIVIIGLLTALMGDLATSFGCSLQWDMHTASITVVAIGTSLPDLFASRAAAQRDNFADNAIGNINGSNAFNVFLGLGFPWLCAAIYHHQKGSQFVVTNLGDLAFSVQIFVLFSILQLVLMTGRRKLQLFGRGELGGPKLYAQCTFWTLITLWLLYIILSISH